MPRTVRRTSPTIQRADSSLDRLRHFSRRIAMRAGGAALIIIAGYLMVAIGDFSISDPSLNTASAASVSNITGPLGAMAADLLLQTIGGAVFLIFVPMVIWGLWALVLGTPEEVSLTVVMRIVLIPVAILFGAGLLAVWPVPVTWPFAAGLGGIVGDGLAGLLKPIFGVLSAPYPAIFTGMIFAAGLLMSWPRVCGLTRERTEDVLDYLEDMVEGVVDHMVAGAERIGALMDRGDGAESDGFPKSKILRSLPVLEARDGDLDDEETARAASEYVEDPSYLEEIDDIEEVIGDDAASRRRQIIRSEPKKRPGRRERREAQHELPVFEPGSYKLPALNLLAKANERARTVISDDALDQNARMLETVLSDFGVRGEIINVRPGPVVTLYELEPAAGVKSSRVIGLADDIARSMSAVAARVAVVPGRNVIGIELPNQDREMVYLRSQLGSSDYENSRGDLTLALGVDIGGEPVFADLARMPHLLIAGTTGSGKSVGINTMILSLLYRLSPDQCKLILIDPKMLELSVYDGIPHLLSPVVTDPRKAVVALKWTVREMEERYQKMSKVGVRNIAGFNERVLQAQEAGEVLSKTVHTGYDEDTGEPIYESEELDFDVMPFIVVVIDEVADLMMVAGKDIEGMVQRLAQMARAAGIHLVMATQRPSVDVITGTIKANFPTRISFQVTSKIDSRTILGEQGAEQLLGMGDMLYMAGGGRLRRVHGPFVADDEVEKIVKFLKKQGKPSYVQEVTEMKEGDDGAIPGLDVGGNTNSGDALYDQAVAVVIRDRKASTSYVQRRLQIGYNRAATLIERMEEEGIISSANHAGKREVLVGEDAA